MIYFIGGAARCGKSSLARSVREKQPGAQSVSGDALRSAIRPHLTPKTHANFNLHNIDEYIDFYANHSNEAIQELQTQADELQPYLTSYIKSVMLESDDDLIVEGVDIWPHLVKRLTIAEHKALFLLDTSPDQWRRILEFDGDHSWIKARELTNEQIKAWAGFSARRSEYIRQECIKYDQPYIDLATTSFETAQTNALLQLTK